jgi:hypothetical protein
VGIQQDRQKGFQTGGREMSSRVLHWVAENEWLDIVEGSAPSKTKEVTTSSLRAMDVGALMTVRTFACTDQKKLMVINLDRLAPYEGTARDERP